MSSIEAKERWAEKFWTGPLGRKASEERSWEAGKNLKTMSIQSCRQSLR